MPRARRKTEIQEPAKNGCVPAHAHGRTSPQGRNRPGRWSVGAKAGDTMQPGYHRGQGRSRSGWLHTRQQPQQGGGDGNRRGRAHSAAPQRLEPYPQEKHRLSAKETGRALALACRGERGNPFQCPGPASWACRWRCRHVKRAGTGHEPCCTKLAGRAVAGGHDYRWTGCTAIPARSQTGQLANPHDRSTPPPPKKSPATLRNNAAARPRRRRIQKSSQSQDI